MIFKLPGPGLEPRSTTWESSDIAITLTAGSRELFAIGRVCLPERQRQGDRKQEITPPPREDGHATIPSPPFSSRDLGYAGMHAQREFKPPG